MNKKEFLSLLSANANTFINDLFKGHADKKELLLNVGMEFFNKENIEVFESLLAESGFQHFLKKRLSSSPARLENTLRVVIRRVALEIPPDLIAKIAEEMASREYRQVESTFYVVPIDQEGYDVFESGFIQVGEQKFELLPDYLRFCDSEEWLSLKEIYNKFDKFLFRDLSYKLINILLATNSIHEVWRHTNYLITPHIERFVKTSYKMENWKLFGPDLFLLFQTRSNTDYFVEFIKKFSDRYPKPGNNPGERMDREALRKLMEFWPVLLILTAEKTGDLVAYLKAFGSLRDEFQVFVWETVLTLEAVKVPGVIGILNSTSFQSLKNFYGDDTSILKFLVKNIINAIAEMKIKKFDQKLYRVVLKLLLTLQVDKKFIGRRSRFFVWLKTQTKSQRIEMELMRFIFFEYLYISLGHVKNGKDMKMSKFCDENHEFFIKILDEVSLTNKFKSDVDLLYKTLLERLRKIVQAPYQEKFENKDYYLQELYSASISLNLEDELFYALDNIDIEVLSNYHESFMDIYKREPERMIQAIMPDYCYRVTLEIASPYVHSVVLPVIGTVIIKAGEGGAYTDGRTIFLPEYINYFKDKFEPLIENRNLTMYVGLALHEAGHIIAGTFKFDLMYYLSNLEKPLLFKIIHNHFEDYRIEAFLIKIKAHVQAEEIIRTMNEYLTADLMLTKELSPAFHLILYIVDQVTGQNNPVLLSEKYINAINDLKNSELYSGRFKTITELINYFIGRVKHIDIANPLGAYPISRELYEIMKHWPDSILAGICDPQYFPTGLHRMEYEGVNPLLKPKPLTREELDTLYKEYNENPKAFLERNNLPVFEELVGGGKGKSDSKNEQFQQYVTSLLGEPEERSYDAPGTIDLSHRTKADDLLAATQTEKPKGLLDKFKDMFGDKEKDSTSNGKKNKKPPSKKNKSKSKRIYSIDPKTKSRTKLTEVKEFTISHTDPAFMKKFQKWRHITDKVYRELSFLLPTIEETHDTSASDGELNMELLIEILSNKNKVGVVEFMDIYKESKRSLEVIIGLDISGSTALLIGEPPEVKGKFVQTDGMSVIELEMTPEQVYQYDMIIDIEKAFAMIFAKALQFITPNVSVYAFNSVTSTNVYKASTIDCVSAFQADSSNRDGDFIRYITDILKKSPAEVKYFYLITDGQPNADNYSGKEAMDDTLIAMREAINSKIKLIYFNIDRMKQDYFDAFQKEATYAQYFRDPEEILPIIPELIKKISSSL